MLRYKIKRKTEHLIFYRSLIKIKFLILYSLFFNEWKNTAQPGLKYQKKGVVKQARGRMREKIIGEMKEHYFRGGCFKRQVPKITRRRCNLNLIFFHISALESIRSIMPVKRGESRTLLVLSYFLP